MKFHLVTISLLPVCTLLLFSCSPPSPPPAPAERGIADLEHYPQQVSAYLAPGHADEQLIPFTTQTELDADWNRRFFSPWHQKQATISRDSAFWGETSLAKRQGFSENLQPYSAEEWLTLTTLQNSTGYPSSARPAIVTRNSSFRALPAHRPFFLDPNQAGEGFPFDYFQSSAVWIGTPILVTHVSTDGAWYFAEAGFTYGWLPADAFAWADSKFRKRYESGHYTALRIDDLSLNDRRGTFLGKGHLGAVFPYTVSTATHIQILVPQRDLSGAAVTREASIPSECSVIKPLSLTSRNLAVIVDTVMGMHYGWGGLYDNRDCSSTLRDLLTPFGVWLGRNSREQGTKGGTLLPLEGLTPDEKRAVILSKAVPFYTLIWMKGHIGLYIGRDTVSGEPLMLHNVWGAHTRDRDDREGRALIGRLVITTLRPGEERADVVKNHLYDKILGITLLKGLPLPQDSGGAGVATGLHE